MLSNLSLPTPSSCVSLLTPLYTLIYHLGHILSASDIFNIPIGLWLSMPRRSLAWVTPDPACSVIPCARPPPGMGALFPLSSYSPIMLLFSLGSDSLQQVGSLTSPEYHPPPFRIWPPFLGCLHRWRLSSCSTSTLTSHTGSPLW